MSIIIKTAIKSKGPTRHPGLVTASASKLPCPWLPTMSPLRSTEIEPPLCPGAVSCPLKRHPGSWG